jgi:AraC-like DNA-binding protein
MSQVVDTKLWYAGDLGAELLRARFGDFSYELHTHDTACLALITAGAIRIRMKGAEFVAQEGDLYAIDAEEPHAGWPVDHRGWCQRTIYADLALLRRRLSDGDDGANAPVLRGPIIRDSALAAAFMAVHQQCEADGPRLLREERYLTFAHRLFARHVAEQRIDPKPMREAAAIRRARDFLDGRLDMTVSLEEIAAASGLPPFRMYRAFERATGMTPHAYQRQARIRAALDLIRRGEPLADIAAATGFADQAHLTRSFKARMGVTPGAYRQARARWDQTGSV